MCRRVGLACIEGALRSRVTMAGATVLKADVHQGLGTSVQSDQRGTCK